MQVGFVNNFCDSVKSTFRYSKEDSFIKIALKISLAALTILDIGLVIHLSIAARKTCCATEERPLGAHTTSPISSDGAIRFITPRTSRPSKPLSSP